MRVMYCLYTRILLCLCRRHIIEFQYCRFSKKMLDIRIWTFGSGRKLIVSDLNWVAMGRHGLILKDNEATGSRKVSGCLPDLWDTI